MRKYLLAAVAVAAVSSPAIARDGQPYVGIEGGILFPKESDADVFVDYTTIQIPAIAGPGLPIAGPPTSISNRQCARDRLQDGLGHRPDRGL